MIKRLTAVLLSLLLSLCCFTGCSDIEKADDDRIKIVATMFPQYDFCREICGDTADIKLLLPPGVESHSYDPTPADIYDIVNCDIFIYTGPEMESWVQTILEGVGENVEVIDLSQCVEVVCSEDEHDEHDEHGNHGHEHHHHHDYDPHIWTSPYNAFLMTKYIYEHLSVISPQYSKMYKENCDNYCAKLMRLDEQLFDIAKNAKRDTLVFGGRFAFGYLTDRYSFHWQAAYDSCSHEAEPSVAKVAELIDYVRENEIPVVYYEELTDPTVARTIASESGAKLLLLHSCHNLSKDDLDSGMTYISIMENNIKNLGEGLC